MSGTKVTVGNAEIISLHDANMQFPWTMFFPGIEFTEIEKYRDMYPDCYGETGFRTDAGAYAVRTGGKTLVVDTGIGPGPIAMLGGLQGTLLDDMRGKGVTPESVDIVVHTHLHFDHVMWNLNADGKPTFPNATYYAPQADYEFFSNAVDSNPQMRQVLPLMEMGRLELYSGETTLAPDVTTMPTPGHTPGHSSILVKSQGDAILITGDVAHHPCQLERLDWSPAFDMDGQAASETRKRVVERLEAEGHLAAFCHFPGTGFGRVVRKDGRRVFQAA